VGTLRYMSPEQALGVKGVADHRVDIYGLGATLYELLTLEPTLQGQDRAEMFRRLLHETPRRPRTLNSAIPFDLETIVLKALRKEPAERYASAGELAEDLKRFLKGQPIHARRPTLRERARGWVRRHAVELTVAGGGLLVVTTVLAVSVAMTIKASRDAARKQTYAERSRQVARRAVDQVLLGVATEWLDHEPPWSRFRRSYSTSCWPAARSSPRKMPPTPKPRRGSRKLGSTPGPSSRGSPNRGKPWSAARTHSNSSTTCNTLPTTRSRSPGCAI
jgi:serine/threonine protein kinase